MSSIYTEIYHIFSPNGQIKQVENALEAVYNSTQIVSINSTEGTVLISKKINKEVLQEETFIPIRQIAEGLYIQITGLQMDVNFIIKKAIKLASDLEYKFDTKLTPDLFAKHLSGKMQQYIQRSAFRIPAFSIIIFGIQDGKVVNYYTDLTAVEHESYANASGKDHSKMTSFLEKHYSKDINLIDSIHLGIATLLQSIGREAEYTEIDAYVFTKENGLIVMDGSEINKYLQEVGEKGF